ncbi:MAG: S9 family peptidase [Acidobacteria bacterium]|nr:S9 family peptidase [Acidobacteriota bacterium]
MRGTTWLKSSKRLLLAVSLLLASAVASAAAGPASTAPDSLLVLGPLPLPAAATESGPLVPRTEPVAEIDTVTADPQAGDEVVLDPAGAVAWREVKPGPGEPISLPRQGVYWLAVRPTLDRWTHLELGLEGADSRALYVDGKLEAGLDEGPGGSLKATVGLARGRHLVLARVERRSSGGEAPKVQLAVSCQPQAGIAWNAPGPVVPASFDQMRAIVSIGPVAVAYEGRLIARRVRYRGRTGGRIHSSVELLDSEGNVVASSIGDASASPVAFSPDSKNDLLLLREKGKHGTNLVLYDAASRSLHTLVRDEPDLGFIHFGPGGTHLLISSARGVKVEKRDPKAARLRRALREKLRDYETRRHLWLVEVATGARRSLTAPGDWVLDDAAFVPAKRAIVYARTVPRQDRPWFATEIRWIDLIKNTDTLVKTFVAGWESRPANLTPSLDGRRLAFFGPPEQVGAGHDEHNVYNREIWVLDLETKKLERVTKSEGPAYTIGRGDLLSWIHNGHGLIASATDGSVTRLVRLDEGTTPWHAERLGTIAETISYPTLSPDRLVAAYVASNRGVLPELQVMEVDSGKERVLERPNQDLATSWRISVPEKAPFKAPDGRLIDAWWYPPTVKVDNGKTPLIVYYYGGATPTTRRFNTTHQVLAANGYAVLVINPHGAYGYGLRFADAHVNDWGPKAAADIQAGIDAFLADHPQIDGKHVGIYGGSYGGFMTEYLISTSDRFAAAVAMYGISDITPYWGAGMWGYTYGDMALAGSFPWNAEKLFAGHSPIYHADRIHTPLLLLHGEADVNVPESESEELYTALRTLGRDVELVTFPGEDHGIAGTWKNWVGHRTLMLDFFDRYLRQQPEAWDAAWKEGSFGGHRRKAKDAR